MGCILRERLAPNNFRNFNFANGGLQLQTRTVGVQMFAFSFLLMPNDLQNSQKLKSRENLYTYYGIEWDELEWPYIQ